MNLLDLLKNLNWGWVAAILASQLVPWLAALATKAPTWATTLVSAALNTLSAFLAAVEAHKGPFTAADWKAAVLGALGLTLGSVLHNRFVIAGPGGTVSPLQDRLHRRGLHLGPPLRQAA